MKKGILLMLLCVSSIMVDGRVIVPFFTAMKEDILPYIDVQSRKNMVELYDAQKRAVVPNRLKGTSEIIELNDNYLKIQLSDFSVFEMAVFQVRSDNYIMTINTSEVSNAAASVVTVYTGSWEKLGMAKRFPTIMTKECYKKLFSDDKNRGGKYMDLIQSAISYTINTQEMSVQQRCYLEWLSPQQQRDTMVVTNIIEIKTVLR